jgi:hypothetical protein
MTNTHEFQHYWHCAHHPLAIKNFFDGRTACEWECHTQELQWYHGGEQPMPKSWPATPRAGSRSAILDSLGV